MIRTPVLVSGALIALSLGSAVKADDTDPPSFAYLLHCSGCHLENGAGDPPVIPDLRYDLVGLLESPAGRDYMVRVPGVTDAPIPAWQMADLMNWMVRYLYPDYDTFKPFTEQEIITGRNTKLYDPIKYRNDLVVESTTGSVSAGAPLTK
ncbi:MAG: hypothetical protein R3F41_17860 [Gammaproteobacteria bacterium]|nr:hypothetical protein [Pseudomonadales bacterium]MCP5347415.1 hypothetical protein [Pseudomonadales bacterium]